VGSRTNGFTYRWVAVGIVLALVASGCVSTRPPSTPSSADFVRSDRDPRLSIRLGPRALQVALPLLLARSSPAAPLYLRHLDEVVVTVYGSDGASFLSPDDSDVILRLRDETSTVWLVRPSPLAPLDRFYLLVDDGDNQVVAYAEGDLVRLLQQAFATSF